MATISDVAKQAGVSKTTVSRVLNHPDLVNQETKQRVHTVMEELSYAPSILAQGMRAQRTRSFGVVIPDFKNLYYAGFVANVEIAARQHGYIAIMCSTEIDPEREKEYITKLIQRTQKAAPLISRVPAGKPAPIRRARGSAPRLMPEQR